MTLASAHVVSKTVSKMTCLVLSLAINILVTLIVHTVMSQQNDNDSHSRQVLNTKHVKPLQNDTCMQHILRL